MNLGPQAISDNLFTKKYRKIQSEYRKNILKVPCGVGPNKSSKNKYGNMLVDGENSGLNFISDSAFRFAKQKVLDKQINKNMTIEEYRLFNNMLSSMPMCFNLFSGLRELLLTNQLEVSKVVKSMFKEIPWINKVTYIDVEFIPNPISDYTDDKSAFDAMILVEDDKGKKGLISIETKYTDLLGSNTSAKASVKDKIITDNKIFDKELVDILKDKGYQQIHRNYLLTYTYAKKNKFKHFANVVISPKDDQLSLNEIERMQEHMMEDKNTIIKIPLEDVVERAIDSENENISKLMITFKNRYFG